MESSIDIEKIKNVIEVLEELGDSSEETVKAIELLRRRLIYLLGKKDSSEKVQKKFKKSERGSLVTANHLKDRFGSNVELQIAELVKNYLGARGKIAQDQMLLAAKRLGLLNRFAAELKVQGIIINHELFHQVEQFEFNK